MDISVNLCYCMIIVNVTTYIKLYIIRELQRVRATNNVIRIRNIIREILNGYGK